MINISEELKSRVLERIEYEVRAGFRAYDDIIIGSTHDLRSLDKELAELARSEHGWNEVKEVVTVLTNESIERLLAEEEQWVAPTDNDRLDWAFEYLEKTGIAARQDYWCCQTCANAGIATEMKDSPAEKPYVGFVYYHEQELESAMAGHYFNLAYGANKEESKRPDKEYYMRREVYSKQPDGRPPAAGQPPIDYYDVNVETYRASKFQFIPVDSPDLDTRRVGSRIMDALIVAGLEPVWNGSASVKVKLKVKWRRRRSTSYKFKPGGAPDLSDDLYKPLGPDDNPSFFTSVELSDDQERS
jgi:hypothetical protein